VIVDDIVLAAGGSNRLGRAKQLLPFAGETLLLHAVQAVAGANPRRLLVVLGAQAAAIRATIGAAGRPVEVLENPRWTAGIGSSIRAGIVAIEAGEPGCDGVLIGVCDQPLVPAAHYARLRATFTAAPDHLVASHYQGGVGVPAFFPRAVFAELRALPVSAGAKRLLERQGARVIHVPCSEAAFDVDTEADYRQLLG
jgi:molybdenum cofactor cytidylyltransferase